MVAFQVEFLKTLEDGVRLVPDLEKLEKVEQFKVIIVYFYIYKTTLFALSHCLHFEETFNAFHRIFLTVATVHVKTCISFHLRLIFN